MRWTKQQQLWKAVLHSCCQKRQKSKLGSVFCVQQMEEEIDIWRFDFWQFVPTFFLFCCFFFCVETLLTSHSSFFKDPATTTTKMLSNTVIRTQDRALALCGPVSVQDLSDCPPGFSLSSHMDPAPMLGLQSGQPRSAKAQRELSPEEQQELRRKINSRERKRMQDLNIAMDALREVMVPYVSPPSSTSSSQSQNPGATPGRRLSKISTLILARNYILLLGSSLQEMRRLLGELTMGMGINTGPVSRLLLTGGWPLISSPSHILLTQDPLLALTSPSSSSSTSSSSAAKCQLVSTSPVDASLAPVQWNSTGASAGTLCPCEVCTLPRFSHSTPAPRFPKWHFKVEEDCFVFKDFIYTI